MTLEVGPVGREEYLAFVERRPVSFLQCPSWPRVKSRWTGERLGWRDAAGRLAGVGLLLRRRVPVAGRSLAVLSEGPAIDWAVHPPGEVLGPLVEHARARGALALRLGPDQPLRRWRAETVKAAVGHGVRLGDVPADETEPAVQQLAEELAAAGWRRHERDDGIAGSTEQAVRIPLAGRTEADLLRGMNQQWRRAIRKAEQAGVTVHRGEFAELVDFHRLYAETGRRDGFPPQDLAHFQRMWVALREETPRRIRLYLARHGGEVRAAVLVVTVGGLAGYAYGGSSSEGRDVYPSNAVHWRVLRDLLAEGVRVYDLRGMTDTLDPDERGFGLVRFKLGTGGDVVQMLGDWDLPIRRLLHRGTQVALPVAVRLRESARGAR